MEAKLNEIGLIVVTIGTIATVYFISNNSASNSEQIACGATEVFRWSDRACYVPQGE
jgi:hypothetical protein